VELINKKGNSRNVIDVPSSENILDCAESKGIYLPYSCRGGACSTCVARLISGSIDQSEQVYLSDDQVGFTFYFALFDDFFSWKKVMF
jgi:ferredoxin